MYTFAQNTVQTQILSEFIQNADDTNYVYVNF